MPDASDVRAFRRANLRDFAETQQLPPLPDCEPFAPFNDAPALPVPEVRVIESDGPAPYHDPTRAARLVNYPSPAQLVREREIRERRRAERERAAFGEARRQADALKARWAAGYECGELRGYCEGWYWGLAFGFLCGCGFVYLAMRLGAWAGFGA